jgi:hypothetical protein
MSGELPSSSVLITGFIHGSIGWVLHISFFHGLLLGFLHDLRGSASYSLRIHVHPDGHMSGEVPSSSVLIGFLHGSLGWVLHISFFHGLLLGFLHDLRGSASYSLRTHVHIVGHMSGEVTVSSLSLLKMLLCLDNCSQLLLCFHPSKPEYDPFILALLLGLEHISDIVFKKLKTNIHLIEHILISFGPFILLSEHYIGFRDAFLAFNV